MPKDLRSYLDEVKPEVDPLTTVGALCDQSEWPLVFHHLKGFPGWRLVDRLVSRRELQARILGCTPDRVVHTLAARIQRIGTGEVKIVAEGPVQSVVTKGADADLTTLPHCIHSEGDAGRYIGAGICMTRDPDSRVRNLAFLRHQIKGPRRTGFLVLPRHTWRHHQKYEQAPRLSRVAARRGQDADRRHEAGDVAHQGPRAVRPGAAEGVGDTAAGFRVSRGASRERGSAQGRARLSAVPTVGLHARSAHP